MKGARAWSGEAERDGGERGDACADDAGRECGEDVGRAAPLPPELDLNLARSRRSQCRCDAQHTQWYVRRLAGVGATNTGEGVAVARASVG